MRVLVCGSRTFADEDIVSWVLDGAMYDENARGEDITVIQGGAQGADALGARWARREAFDHLVFPADWDRHGKAAGFIRNQQMLDEGKPDLVVAFTDKPLAESRGTNDMVTRARKAGVKVIHVEVVQ